MRRDINLLNVALRPRRQTLTPVRAAIAAALSGVAVLGVAAWEHRRGAEAETARARLAAELRSVQDELKRISSAGAGVVSPALVEEQARMQREVDARRALTERLAGGGHGDTDGFSRYLVALSRQSVPGLWVTGFGVSGSGEDLSIRGRALRSELLPGYLQRLGGDEALRGRPLSGITIRTVDLPAPGGDAAQAARPAPVMRVVEFALGASAIPAAGGRQ